MNEELQTVMIKIQSILNDTSFDKLIEVVLKRLVSFGYTPTKDDDFSIAFGIQKVQSHIQNVTNQEIVPEGLFEVATDMVCGEFLNVKYLSGKLEMDNLDFEGIVKSVTEGDTSVTFEVSGQDEDKFRKLIAWLMDGKGCDLLCYRKMRW